jgi:hypothetical protein
MRTSFHLVAESALRQLHWSDVKWPQDISRENHQKPDSGKKSALPGVSCIDHLDWRMTEIQATDKEQLRKSTISAPLWPTNAAWRLSQTSPPSALVVKQISFRGNPR